MAIEGEYVPSQWDWVAKQIDQYESSGGTQGVTIQGAPVIVMTMRGRRSGNRCGRGRARWRGQRCPFGRDGFRRGGHDRLGRPGNGIRGRGDRRIDHRLTGRRQRARRTDQRGIFAYQTALTPVDFDQEIDRRHVHRRAAGDAHDRTAGFIQRDAEVQFVDQPLRARQTDAVPLVMPS